MTGHGWGTGSIRSRGVDTHQLRYSIGGRRFTSTFHGSKADARVELRRLLRSGDTGEHVAPDRMTVAQWTEHWLSTGAPGKRRVAVGTRTAERYAGLLKHVLPVLGDRPLQQLQATEIDDLYRGIEGKLAPRTAYHVHVVFNACLNAAVRTRRLTRNPMESIAKAPAMGEVDHGQVLDAEQLRALLAGLRGSPLQTIVAVAIGTGARLGEIMGLQWRDLDVTAKTLRIERSVEETAAYGLRLKAPKTGERGKRTIAIDDDLIALLVAEREKHLRIAAGVPDNAAVEVGLVRLPPDALMFPALEVSFTALRNPLRITVAFSRAAARLGFEGLRFHDLRGSHETMLLDAGVPVHVVAARCGHDAAVLLRSYAKRTKKADTAAANVIGALSRIVLR